MDYVKTLSEDEQEFMRKFVDEYYCGGHTKENSLHRQAFQDSYETPEGDNKSIKQEMYLAMNAQNRDITGIAGCSNNMVPLDECLDYLIEEEKSSIEDDLATSTPENLLSKLIQECTDELGNDFSNAEVILRTFSSRVIHLSQLVKKELDRQKRLNKNK
jgi:hypothetical protein